MSLSPLQLQQIGAAIRANPQFWANGTQMENDDIIAGWFNQPTDQPPVPVWRKTVSEQDIAGSLIPSEVAALSNANLNVYLVYSRTAADATSANTRNGFKLSFGENSQSWANLLDTFRRTATRLEALFSETQGEAAVTSMDGVSLSPYDIRLALDA